MAVEDKYIDANIAAGKLGNPALSQGAEVVALTATFEVAAADDNGSVYRIGTLNENLIPWSITITNDAITGGTDYELGFYDVGVGGAAVDIDVLLGTTTMASARAEGSGISGLSAVGQSDATKKIYELLGKTVVNKKAGYDLAVTANTVGTAAGTITVKGLFLKG